MALQTNGKKVIKVIGGNGLNELALFAGAGGGILGGHLLGWRTVCAVEWESYPASVLLARQNDGILPPFPIWDDVQTFDGNPWRGIVDVVSGGFPCQDISAAGKGAGIDGERSKMWKEMARIICEVRPKYAFIENSPMLTIRGLESVLADLAKMGFDAEWGVLSAADVGANHLRERIWIVAHSNSISSKVGRNDIANEKTCGKRSDNNSRSRNNDSWKPNSKKNEIMAHARCKYGKSGNSIRMETCKAKWSSSTISNKPSIKGLNRENWQTEPNVGRVVNGVANGMDRLKAIGNGQVPLCAATAWNILKGRLDERL
jgi:DNA (cytosine-5)-methyltransferase 1